MPMPIPNIPDIVARAHDPRQWGQVDPPQPQPNVGLWHEPTHQAARAAQPPGPTAASANQLTNYVPPGGLHAATPAGAFAEALQEMQKASAQTFRH
jgi:hypothetical protein